MDGNIGRPSDFTQEIADAICERIADGESLRSICTAEDMPNKATVFRWLAAHETFRDQYAHAREAQGDTFADDITDIADDGRNDWIEKRNADGEVTGWQENGEAIRRSQLRIEARKWLAAKLQPKKYGDKLNVDHSGSIRKLSDEDIDARIAALLAEAGASSAVGREGSSPADE